MKIKFFLLLFTLYCFFSPAILASSTTPVVDNSEKIYDFADLFTSSEEQKLYNDVSNYIQSHNMDMAIVTINNNNKHSAMAYADDFYDYNNFGLNSTNDGLLFLIDMDTREMWISTTGNAILYYSDARIDNILDASYNYIVKQDYYNCASVFIEKSSKYASNGIPSSNKDYTINMNGNYVPKRNNNSFVSEYMRLNILYLLHNFYSNYCDRCKKA